MGKYAICASSASPPPKKGEGRVLKEKTALDTFVAALPSKKIDLTSEPDPKTPSPVDAADDIAAWLVRIDENPEVSIAFAPNDKKDDLDLESFQVKLATPWPMTFSSTTDLLKAAFDDASSVSVPGLDSDGVWLVLGLYGDIKSTPVINATVQDLFDCACIPDMAKCVPELLLDLSVTLDPTVGKKRNALWFRPSYALQTIIRLQFTINEIKSVGHFVERFLPGLTVVEADAVCKQNWALSDTSKGERAVSNGEVIFTIRCDIQDEPSGTPVRLTAGLEFSESIITMTFVIDTPNSPTDDGNPESDLANPTLLVLLKWLGGLINDDIKGFFDKALAKDGVLSRIRLRRLIVILDTAQDVDNPKLSSVAVDVEIATKSFGQPKKTGTAGVVVQGPSRGNFGLLGRVPLSEFWTDLQPITKPAPAKAIRLAYLIPGQSIDSIPNTIPSEITRAYLSLSQTKFSIGATITAKESSAGEIGPDKSTVPQPYLGSVTLDASYTWGKSAEFSLELGINAALKQSKTSKKTPATTLVRSLSYKFKGSTKEREWVLKASLNDLYASSLVEFFDASSAKHVMPLIDTLALDKLAVNYTYKKTGASSSEEKASSASEFTMEGLMHIASVKLDVSFEYKDTWKFKATLSSQNGKTTVGDVLKAVLGKSDLDLPDFIADTPFTEKGKDAFILNLGKSKLEDEEAVEFFYLAVEISIAKLGFTFAQLRSSDWDDKAPPKRLIKASVNLDVFPEIEVALVGQLKVPLDSIIAPFDKDEILVKDKFKNRTPADLLVCPGSHFGVVEVELTGEKSCILSYDFKKPKKTKPDPKTIHSADPRPGEKTDPDPSPPEPSDSDSEPASNAPMKKKAGAISITNVGLRLGPVSFTLIGFDIGMLFKSLDTVPHFDVQLEGLAAAFDKAPLTIAGVIRRGHTDSMVYYAGGLIFGYAPYQFMAAGFYGQVNGEAGVNPYTTIFIFAKLDGPLISVGFADITGLTAGFGYNSEAKIPTIKDVTSYPLVAPMDLKDASSALEALTTLTDPKGPGWFQPVDNTYWGAAGLKVDAFQMVLIDAVILAQFGSSVKLALFAVAVADIPNKTAELKFAHVELGIAATVDLDTGVLSIESQLAPGSYILHPDCHLTGGMALMYLFDAPHADKSNVGNFVFTIGGYHEAFPIPAGWPKPPRLGISWDLGGCLSISGEAYFAMTPKVCMGGGRLHASFSAGPISAWFDAFADFLINYKPFYFTAEERIAVGVSFNIDFLFIHTYITVEIGAGLYLWGPPLAGTVHVDFWITSFDINFGQRPGRIEAVSLYQFYLVVLPANLHEKAHYSEEDEKKEKARPANEAHNFAAQSGLLNNDEDPRKADNAPWVVRGGLFYFVLECKMPISNVRLVTGHGDDGTPVTKPVTFYNESSRTPVTPPAIYSKPMQLTHAMASTLDVEFYVQHGNASPAVETRWRLEMELRPAPSGLWNRYDPSTDPSTGTSTDKTKTLLDPTGGSIPLMMALRVIAPKPLRSHDPFDVVNAADAAREDLTAERPFPTPRPSNKAWAALPSELDLLPETPDRDAVREANERQYGAVRMGWGAPAWEREEREGFVEEWQKVMRWGELGLEKLVGTQKRQKRQMQVRYYRRSQNGNRLPLGDLSERYL
ncbi:hypothetical protein F5144DRAFT_650477 [Chaetomium tenue]|uniref:Uncharacterized protein n=1 Tax=Chaetomium tenue TaxID=1854479 RepID=A0ACB7P929_9PEZI|nr:hypothetical protein F5144DRAFT_650477 [Chaetomium globosum]